MRKKSDTYKYVYYDDNPSPSFRNASAIRYSTDLPWRAVPCYGNGIFKKQGPSKRFSTEREAALYVDKWFIEQGRKPVNILKAV